jgi:type II secretory pathway pseudopilin PulG
MKIRLFRNQRGANWDGKTTAAFSLIETLVAIAVFSTVVVSVLAGTSSGMFVVRLARENARATQILLEKVETIRLYNWDQIEAPGFIPDTFTAPYETHSPGNELIYQGSFTISPVAMNASYSNDLKRITVQVTWNTGTVQRQRSISTYFSKYGLQDYVY